jgi:hypothetical protein
MATFKYHIVDSRNNVIEGNLPDEEHAKTVVGFLKEQNPTETYEIQEERIYTVKGLGRDPDLH